MKTLYPALLILLIFLGSACLLAQDDNPLQPGSKIYHNLVFHNGTQKVFLFGGLPAHGWATDEMEEVWSYDIHRKKWNVECLNQAIIYTNPLGQKTKVPAHSPVLDQESNKIIFFNRMSKTWAFDPETMEWEMMSPEISPLKRCGQSMVYDSESDRVILFGGFRCTSASDPFYNDIWAYDYNSDSWEEMSPDTLPQERAYATMVYNPLSDKVMMFGGRSSDPVSTSFYDNSIWVYDHNTDRCSELVNIGGPEYPYSYSQMIYHPGNNELFLYGGGPMSGLFNGLIKDEAWIFDCADSTWVLDSTINAPAKTSIHAMVYIPGLDEILLFGGETGYMMYSDVLLKGTWKLDYNTKTWYEEFFAFAGNDAFLCASQLDDIVLGGTPTAWGGVEPFNYNWSGEGVLDGISYPAAEILDNPQVANPGILQQMDSLTLFLQVSDAAGTTARDTANYRISSLSVCPDLWSESFFRGDSLQLDHCVEGGMGPLTYHWQPEEYLSDPTLSNPWAIPDTNSITFNLVATDTLGCEASASFTAEFSTVGMEKLQKKSAFYRIIILKDQAGTGLYLENLTNELLTCHIVGVNGQLMEQFIIHPGSSNKKLNGYSPGIYFYRVQGVEKHIGFGKLLIQ